MQIPKTLQFIDAVKVLRKDNRTYSSRIFGAFNFGTSVKEFWLRSLNENIYISLTSLWVCPHCTCLLSKSLEPQLLNLIVSEQI